MKKLLILVAVGACSPEEGMSPPGSVRKAILGDAINLCSGMACAGTAENARANQAHAITRIAVRSPAFAECMNATMRNGSVNANTIVTSDFSNGGCNGNTPPYTHNGFGPYVSCKPGADLSQGGSVNGGENNDDAAWNELIDRQLARAMNALQVDVDLVNNWGAGGTTQNGYDSSGPDSNINQQVPIAQFTLNNIITSGGTSGGLVPTFVHETMHNMGYDHGCFLGAGGANPGTHHGNCGRDMTTWNPFATMNMVAAFCATEVLQRSQNAANPGCGTQGGSGSTTETLVTCQEGGMMIVSQFAALSTDTVPCHCVPDSVPFAQNAAGDQFGSAVTTGDFNGDGFTDLAAGSPGKSAGAGQVFVYRGARLGLTPWRSFSVADLSISGTGQTRCGTALVAGDFNGDGASDLAIGCPGASVRGRVAVVPGCLGSSCPMNQDGLQAAQTQVLVPADNSFEFGVALAAGSMVGGDSLDDLAIGAPGTHFDQGTTEVWRGNGAGPIMTRQFTVAGASAGDRFGEAVAFGNVAGNSTLELIVGAPGSASSRGAVFWSSGVGTNPVAVSLPATGSPLFGKRLVAGNIVGDNYDDVLISTPGMDVLHVSAGSSGGPGMATSVWSTTGAGTPSLAMQSDFPYAQVVVGYPAMNEALRLVGTGTTLSPREWLGQTLGTAFWSEAATDANGGFCQMLNNITEDVPCPIDGLTFSASALGTSAAFGFFGNGLQVVLGAPTDLVGPKQQQVAAGSVYVRGGDGLFAGNAWVDPQDYRIDQVATLYGGMKDRRALEAPTKWGEYFCEPGEVCLIGNVDNDLGDDIIAFSKSLPGKEGDVWVARSNGANAFIGVEVWHGNFCPGNEVCQVGDVNNDGRADLVSFVQSATAGHHNHVHVVSTQSGAVQEWSNFFCTAGERCLVGDIDGVNGVDILAFNQGAADVWVARSNGSTSFLAPELWHSNLCPTGQECHVGDVNADGRADVVRMKGGSPEVWVSLSTGSSFAPPRKWSDFLCLSGETCRLGDMNGDGRADLTAFSRDVDVTKVGDVYVGLSNGYDFGPPKKWHESLCVGTQLCEVGDVNNDGRRDAVVFLGNTAGKLQDVEISYSLP
jgi:hypothetical protein